MTYGQTGSGKTYTILGPAGTFSRTLVASDITEPGENWGIFPRTALKIY
jgi:hypothetical protein